MTQNENDSVNPEADAPQAVNPDDAPKAPRAVNPDDIPSTPEKEPFDEAAFRERLRRDCLTACETWPVRNLQLLELSLEGQALTGVLTESVMASFERITKDRSTVDVLAELLAERKQREKSEPSEPQDDTGDSV